MHKLVKFQNKNYPYLSQKSSHPSLRFLCQPGTAEPAGTSRLDPCFVCEFFFRKSRVCVCVLRFWKREKFRCLPDTRRCVCASSFVCLCLPLHKKKIYQHTHEDASALVLAEVLSVKRAEEEKLALGHKTQRGERNVLVTPSGFSWRTSSLSLTVVHFVCGFSRFVEKKRGSVCCARRVHVRGCRVCGVRAADNHRQPFFFFFFFFFFVFFFFFFFVRWCRWSLCNGHSSNSVAVVSRTVASCFIDGAGWGRRQQQQQQQQRGSSTASAPRQCPVPRWQQWRACITFRHGQ